MFSKIRQIITDHKAMNLLRRNLGDMELVSYASNDGGGFDCYPYQRDEYASAKDPAEGIIAAIKMADEIDKFEMNQPDNDVTSY